MAKKNIKISIRMILDPDAHGLPAGLDEKLQSVENIITDTEAFYTWTTQYMENILTHVPVMSKHPRVPPSPDLEITGKTAMAQTLEYLPGDAWDNAIVYKGVTKDVDETS